MCWLVMTLLLDSVGVPSPRPSFDVLDNALQVYDATSFLKEHPGGGDSILLVAGTDATEEFDAIHSEKAKKQLLSFAIGRLATTPVGE